MRDYNRNAAGYVDLTATEAIEKVDREEAERQKRISLFVCTIKQIAELSGFKILNRIEILDERSGRVYR